MKGGKIGSNEYPENIRPETHFTLTLNQQPQSVMEEKKNWAEN